MTFRRDVVSFPTGAKRNSAGVLIVPASLSRTGVQEYRRADGSVVREFRPESEVFAPAALESLRAAPVTIGHPAADVTEETLDSLTVGLASDRDPVKTERDGNAWVETPLAITRKSAIRKAESKELSEISLGYDARIDWTPGVSPSGQPYDCVQRDIRVNHVALLPAGQARAGRQARLRLDGAEEILYQEEQRSPNLEPKPIVKIRLDGVEVVENSAEHVALLNKQVAAAAERATKAEADLAAAKADSTAKQAKLDGLTADLEVARKVDVAGLVAAELKFRDSALPALPQGYSFEGKSREQVKRDAIGAEACKRVDAKPESERAAYLDGAFEHALASKPAGAPQHAGSPNPNSRADSAPENSIAARSDALRKGTAK